MWAGEVFRVFSHCRCRADATLPCGRRSSRTSLRGGSCFACVERAFEETVPFRMGWKEQAACLGTESELWFPNEHIQDPKIPRARAICASCLVTQACLDYALANPKITPGVWGGLLEKERRRLLKRTQAS